MSIRKLDLSDKKFEIHAGKTPLSDNQALLIFLLGMAVIFLILWKVWYFHVPDFKAKDFDMKQYYMDAARDRP